MRDDPRRVMIRNGIDPDDIAGLRSTPRIRRQRFRLSHVGTLYGARDAAPVFAAIRDLMRAGDGSTATASRCGSSVTRSSKRPISDSIPVTFIDYVDHRAGLGRDGRRLGAALLSATERLGDRPGKSTEYLASGRPVLCVADPSNIAYRLVDRRRGWRVRGRRATFRRSLVRSSALSAIGIQTGARPWLRACVMRCSVGSRADTHRRARRGPARGNLERCDDPVASTTAFMTAARDVRLRVIVAPEWYPWPERPGYGSFCREQVPQLQRGTTPSSSRGPQTHGCAAPSR